MFRPHMNTARIEGNIVRVVSKARQTFLFEGAGLHKVGSGQSVRIELDDTRYTGELVAISPSRAILHMSPLVAGHGIETAVAAH